MIQITQLLIHPVKSLRGFSVDSAHLTPKGLEHDRQWMIINDSNKFVTQRKFSQMVLIHTAIDNGRLILSAPHKSKLAPLSIEIDQTPKGEAFDALIWKDTCQVLDEGPKASQWLGQALGLDVSMRLVRMASSPRPQSKPELLGEHTHTYFADAAPFLVANLASLWAINAQMQDAGYEPVAMENFRPNIVISGIDAFGEHRIKQLTHDAYQLQHCYPCQRCVMPTINRDNGQRHPQQQPFSLIADINAMPNNAKAPAFGENAILVKGDGQVIRVGDRLLATNTSEPD